MAVAEKTGIRDDDGDFDARVTHGVIEMFANGEHAFRDPELAMSQEAPISVRGLESVQRDRRNLNGTRAGRLTLARYEPGPETVIFPPLTPLAPYRTNLYY